MAFAIHHDSIETTNSASQRPSLTVGALLTVSERKVISHPFALNAEMVALESGTLLYKMSQKFD